MSTENASPMPAGRSTSAIVALWVLSVLLAALFLMAGSMKFVAAEQASAQFAGLGYPDWFRVLIGAIEVGGGLLLLVPRTAFYAAAVLAVVMLGAVYTVLSAGWAQAVVPAVVFILLVIVGYARRPRAAV
jgi:uncharacterized membrane protein YphA (DoxX/SURF4 family)